MLLVITRSDDTEESYDVAAQTKLRSSLRDATWFFVTTSGGQLAFAQDTVADVKLGNVEQTSER